MSFSSYLGKVQKIFNICNDQKEPYTEEMKVRFHFRTAQHTLLGAAIEALKVRDSIGSETLTFTEAANHLSEQVSILPEFVSKGRCISCVERDHGAKHTGYKGIYKKDVPVYTEFYNNLG